MRMLTFIFLILLKSKILKREQKVFAERAALDGFTSVC